MSIPQPIEKALKLNARILFSPKGFALTLGLYLLTLALLRLILFPGASDDDAEQIFYAQAFAWGYKWNQPPLYTWLVIAAEQVFGTGLAAVLAVKFFALFTLYWFLRKTGKLLTGDNTLAALCGLSALGFYYIGWDAVLNYSHTVLLGAFIAATLYVLFKLEQSDSPVWYVVTGAVIGLGMLTKYNYAAFIGPFLVASLSHQGFRKKLLCPKALLIPVIAVAIIAPHLYWALTDVGSISANTNLIRFDAADDALLSGLGEGLLDGGAAVLSFLSPLLIIAILFFPKAFLPGGLPTEARNPYQRLFGLYFLVLLLLLFTVIALFDVQNVRNHWLMPLLPFPLYVFMRLQPHFPSSERLRLFAGTLSILALVVVVAMTGRAVIKPMSCKKCSLFIPYKQIAEEIQKAGFTNGTIITYDYPVPLTGNLRRYIPDARYASQRFDNFLPAKTKTPGQCLAIWSMSSEYSGQYRMDITAFAQKTFGAVFTPDVATQEFTVNVRNGREIKLRYAFIPPETSGTCR